MAYRTLVLEDDESTRSLLAMVLARRGHEVLSYESPMSCPDLVWSECHCCKDKPCFDFLISDNMMPGMTGLEFLEMQLERGCILDSRQKALISGSLGEFERQAADRLHCRLFPKPIDWTEFNAWLEEGENLVRDVREETQTGPKDPRFYSG